MDLLCCFCCCFQNKISQTKHDGFDALSVNSTVISMDESQQERPHKTPDVASNADTQGQHKHDQTSDSKDTIPLVDAAVKVIASDTVMKDQSHGPTSESISDGIYSHGRRNLSSGDISLVLLPTGSPNSFPDKGKETWEAQTSKLKGKPLKSKNKSEKKKKKNDRKPNKSKHASVSERSECKKQKPNRKEEVHTTKQDHKGFGTKMKDRSHDRESESASGWSHPNERTNLDYHEGSRALQRDEPSTPFSTSFSGNRKEDLDEELKKMKERLSRTNEELHGVRQDLENTRTESDEKIRKLEEDLERKTEEIKRLKADKKDRQDLENTMRVFNEKIRRYEEDLERKTEQIKHLEAEKSDLLNRLSSEAAARMTYNNPNITDLSDQDRPTKISERYTELYDNQWTDAFQNLQNSYKLPDAKAIEVLLDVLHISFGVCKKIREQRETLVRNINEFVGEAGGDVIVSEVMTTLKVAQKKNIAKMHKDYAKKVQEELKTKYSKELQCIGPYVIECVELCLLMNIQDQPLELRGVVSGGNPVFDVTVFRPYTKSGSRIEHMVWPALYLYNKGPLLCRGVAQGMSDAHKSTIIKVDTSKKNVKVISEQD